MPLASSAQGLPPGGAHAASGQTPPPDQALGITVTGKGVAAAPVSAVLGRIIARSVADEARATSVGLGGTVGVEKTGGCPQAGISGGASVVDVSTMIMRIAVTETVTYAITK